MGEKRKKPDGDEPGSPPPETHHTAWPTPSADQEFKDLYRKPPDFKQLALLDPDFAAFVKGRELDFNDPESVMQLTRTLLKLDFDLKIDLPCDRLCPPVANRHNYILWLKDLLDTSSYEPRRRKLVGLDIGTGASCIYPLLGCTQRPWSFIATDIDKKSLEYARKNVKLNGLEGRINVVSRNPTESLIPLDDLEIDSIGFCMTNPPFYESEEEMLRSANQKSRPPSTTCTGVKTEMVTEGGEVGFVERILEESLVLRKRVQWYTSMFGFSSSVTRLLEKLKDHRIDNYAVTEFVQGNKTRRWAVAWSFQSMRPTQSVARGTSSIQTKALLPLAAEVEVIVLPLLANISKFSGDFSGAIAGLDLMSWEWNGQRLEGIGRTVGNVWNRAWRRKKKREMNAQADGQKDQENWERPGFGFMVWVQVRKDAVSVGCRWLEGHDGTVFESFQGFLKSTARTLFPPGEGTSEK